MAQIYCTRTIPARKHEVFNYMLDPNNFAKMLEKSVDVEVLSQSAELSANAEYELQMTRYGLSQKVRLRITDLVLDRRVTYKQSEGLFEAWSHAQIFEDTEDGQTRVTDVVDYEMPFHFFGHLLSDLVIKKDMSSMLEKRLEFVESHFAQKSIDPSVDSAV